MNCLQSVYRFRSDIPLEIILADDCSSDLTASITDRVAGIRVARTSQNQRFLRNCNQAAELAKGQYILFLNNDTAVTDGWLDALLAPFADPGVGITGPKLLFADGKLQEAGGIIWRDASGWNFGRADDPEKPAYNYLRDVDYVSGAALCIRSELWRLLGGFDDRFAPAYYEDADICFSARAAGYRVVYQPQSVVYHFEGVSNGTDLNSGVKQHQVTNQSVFLEKWRLELEKNHFPNAEHVIHARDRSRSKPCVLVIDHYVPHHDKDAGGRSTYMYIKLLLELGCRVQFMGANFFPHQPYTGSLQALGVEVLVGESIARHLDSWLDEHAPYIDEIFLHRPHVAEQFLPHLERMKPRPPISFFGHDLHHLRIEREAALKDDDALRRDARQWQKRELAVFKRVDRVYYFSDVEVEALKDLVSERKLRRIPLYAMRLGDLPDFAPEAPREIVFVGGYNHPPNVDAALWLAEEILPAVREVVPDVHLHLVGSNPPTDVLGLACESITVHGYVSDEALEALYRRVAAVVVPLRYGAGVKGKLIEAIANHVPVVTTDIGVEGILDAETVMWVENTASAIAAQVSALLTGSESPATKLERHAAWLHKYFDSACAADALRADIPALAALRD
jgi:GT2 family glycosyltransferase